MNESIEDARARLDEETRAAEARQEGVKQLAQDVKALSTTVKSPGGEIAVTASPSGRVSNVTFTQAAESLSAAALSELVTATIARAQHRSAMDAVERSAELLGEDSPFVTQLRDDALAAYPDVPTDTIEYR